jgi:hypothetical protein
MILFALLFLATATDDAPDPPLDDYSDGNYWNQTDMDEYYHRKHSGPCLGLNTFRNSDGLCECVAGFEFGEPQTFYGCWNCDHKCHSHGACVHPGKCECQARYHGDGITSCEPIYPELLALAPISCYSDEQISVNVSFHFGVTSWLDRREPKCRFGDAVVRAFDVSDAAFACRVPRNLPGVVPVAISFDGEFWSREAVTFEFKTRRDALVIVPMVLLYGLAIAGLGVFLWKVVARRQSRKRRASDGKPLIAGGRRGRKRWAA